METTCKLLFLIMFSQRRIQGTWFPLKENVLVRSGFIGETCILWHKRKWKTTLKSLVSKGKNEGKYKEILITQSTHKGNHMETPGFPHVSLRYETIVRSGFWISLMGKHKGTSGILQWNLWENTRKLQVSASFPKIGNFCAPVPRISLLGNSGKPHVT